ncbi:alpha/beta fold hydrolase [Smaragdicoccus niigatensis]|uniref:alpha/beta fold hydrolase n=1 Tax=Smaragdicoccus niigatensis TaxID=359359 RepID=UPI00037A395D|nr:alpha/beta hydrolase [Smaragdicoccus niigatensis]
MPIATVNGIPINYTVKGSGQLVVMIMGTGSPGRVWDLHQTPALVKAGYRVCTFDNRGISPSYEAAHGMTINDLVADTAGLIKQLGGPAYLVGTSMGARVAAEVALAHPELVSKAVLMGGHGRFDQFQRTLSAGERELDQNGVKLPAKYQAAVTAVMNLSPATLADERAARDWLDIFEFTIGAPSAGVKAQRRMDREFNRVDAYRGIRVPVLGMAFADDRMIPPYLTEEVAQAIPGARYVSIPDTGHYGYLEKPELVNQAMLDFFSAS